MKEEPFHMHKRTPVGRCSECRALCFEFRYDEVCHACYVKEEMAIAGRSGVPLRKYEPHPDILILGVRK